MASSKTKAQVWVVNDGTMRSRSDQLATEEPLEIRLTDPQRTIAITMRTPGADFALTAGFLYTEGLIHSRDDIHQMRYCVDPAMDGVQRYNLVTVDLRTGLVPDLQPLERHFYTTSACGVCGKTSLDALKIRCEAIKTSAPVVAAEVIHSLPEQIRRAQGIFQVTGGLHAAALFDAQGQLRSLQEDVGRHNALDKLIGSACLSGELPLENQIVMVSGRASFEILQKCLAARVPIVCAVSAPSSLAVSLAQEFGITLIGFLREQRFNIYSGRERIQIASKASQA